MSDTVYYKGKLIKNDKKPNETKLEYFSRVLKIDQSKIDKDFIEEILYDDPLYDNYIYLGEVLYTVKDKESLDQDQDIYKAKKINDKDYEFEVKFYNGGCSFDEAIETALNNLEVDE